MTKPTTPCFNCTDRVPGCHSICERYKDFKESGYYKLIHENRYQYYSLVNYEGNRKRNKHEIYMKRDGKKV